MSNECQNCGGPADCDCSEEYQIPCEHPGCPELTPYDDEIQGAWCPAHVRADNE